MCNYVDIFANVYSFLIFWIHEVCNIYAGKCIGKKNKGIDYAE